MKYPVLCIFLVAVSRVRPHFTLPVKSLSDQENAISGNMHRQRRTGLSFYTTGVVKTGLRALNNLLKDTRELPVVDMTYRDFVKDGGFDRALLDFQAVTKQYADSKFAKFKSMSEFMSTEVGDRFIVLRRRGENGRPEIEVMRFKDDRSMGRQFSGERIDRITYTN